jgi:hypothetical protein
MRPGKVGAQIGLLLVVLLVNVGLVVGIVGALAVGLVSRGGPVPLDPLLRHGGCLSAAGHLTDQKQRSTITLRVATGRRDPYSVCS